MLHARKADLIIISFELEAMQLQPAGQLLRRFKQNGLMDATDLSCIKFIKLVTE